jgi:cobalamin-dependent methionine synthase I
MGRMQENQTMPTNKVYSQTELPVYQVSGDDLRIHWNSTQVTKTGINGETITQWEANEALCSVFDNRHLLIEKIIGSVYTPGAEIATINNQTAKPDEYEEYQEFRALAKTLADGWLEQN